MTGFHQIFSLLRFAGNSVASKASGLWLGGLISLFSSAAYATAPSNGVTTFSGGTLCPIYSGMSSTLGVLSTNVRSTGWDFRVYSSSNVSSVETCIENAGTLIEVLYGASFNGVPDITAVALTAGDGKIFDLNTIDVVIDSISSGVVVN